MALTEKGIAALEIIKTKFSNEEFSCKDIGVAGGVLTGLVNQGYIIKLGGSPMKYKLADNKSTEIKTTNTSDKIKDVGKSIQQLIQARSEIKSRFNITKHRMGTDNFCSEKGSEVGIYKIVFKPNPSMLYIGKTDRPFEQRWEEHRKNLLSGNHHCVALQNKFNETGKNLNDFEFDILQEVEKDHSAIDLRERYWIQKYEEDPNDTLFNTMKPKLHKV